MKTVTVNLASRSYKILIANGLIDNAGKLIESHQISSRLVVISNPKVFDLYGERLMKSLLSSNLNVSFILIPDAEAYKDFFWSYHILSELLKLKLDRKSCLLALGGGVIGDITGFCASLYMRGIRFIQVPTTLLAQVDSSVGGKTGVNHPLGKNMIGTFYQPSLVIADIDTLKTLPQRELLCGIAEVIKYGIIKDTGLFDYLANHAQEILTLNTEALTHIITRSCEIKADIVSQDEQEAGLRAILNFGHTIGHAIETEGNYSRFLHGEAVAIGMHIASQIAYKAGLLSLKDVTKITSLLKAFDFNLSIPSDMSDASLLSHMMLDKKVQDGKLRLILPTKIGNVQIRKDIALELISKTIKENTLC